MNHHNKYPCQNVWGCRKSYINNDWSRFVMFKSCSFLRKYLFISSCWKEESNNSLCHYLSLCGKIIFRSNIRSQTACVLCHLMHRSFINRFFVLYFFVICFIWLQLFTTLKLSRIDRLVFLFYFVILTHWNWKCLFLHETIFIDEILFIPKVKNIHCHLNFFVYMFKLSSTLALK